MVSGVSGNGLYAPSSTWIVTGCPAGRLDLPVAATLANAAVEPTT